MRPTPTCEPIRLTLPPSVNHTHISANGRRFRSPQYLAWIEESLYRIRRRQPCDRPVHVHAVVRDGAGWRMNRDLDNLWKAILDVLVDSGTLVDDSCQHVVGLHIEFTPDAEARKRRKDRRQACIEIVIQPQ